MDRVWGSRLGKFGTKICVILTYFLFYTCIGGFFAMELQGYEALFLALRVERESSPALRVQTKTMAAYKGQQE